MTSALKLPDTQSDEMLEIVTDPDPPVTMALLTTRGVPGAYHASLAALLVRASGVQENVTAPGPTP